jgi:hypothetical protein
MGVAFVALLAALSGTAIALPGTNSVNSGDIVNNTVRGKDIRNGSVGGKDIKNGSVKSLDVGDDSLTGTDINESTLDQAALPGPAAFYAFDNNTGEICNVGCTELTLRGIPAGAYLILAKIRVLQEDHDADTIVHCELVAGADMATADTDLATFAIQDNDAPVATLPMEVVHTFEATDNASINCDDGDFGNVSGTVAKIAAVSLGSVNVR